ncbi:MAG TPA: riboflavin biosynthesis protein RibF [Abditibacteriaceae bacterium]|jgi:riboflavin kinase/FMN adenylyltransferase
MQFYDSIPTTPFDRETALAIGTFDGVHRGHASLVERLKGEAAARGLAACVLTFTDLPYRFFHPEASAKLLTLPPEKRTAFESLAPDVLWLVQFDEFLAGQTAPDFARDILRDLLRVRLLVCGPDFALGRGREGNVEALRALGETFGFDVLVLSEKIAESNEPISSTRIREGIERGEVEDAARMLARPYALKGTVVSGQQLGRTIGFPTINIAPHPMKVLPARGVYAVRALWTENGVETSHRAALNIGLRPTVNGTKQQIEFHVLDETIDIPPRDVRVEFIARLRDEQKFDGLEALAAQLQRDILCAADSLS